MKKLFLLIGLVVLVSGSVFGKPLTFDEAKVKGREIAKKYCGEYKINYETKETLKSFYFNKSKI